MVGRAGTTLILSVQTNFPKKYNGFTNNMGWEPMSGTHCHPPSPSPSPFPALIRTPCL